jgi:RNA polymerase sigma-70 factor (ECF subfamily)
MDDVPGTSDPEAVVDESNLVERLRAGDEDAFATCVRSNCGRMLQVAQRILNDDEDARDAVQDAFLSAFRQIAHFEGRARLATWLHRIVVNAALARLRSRQRCPEQSIEDLLPHFGEGEHQLDPPAPWKATSETIALNQETRALVRRQIARLPESYRTVLLLRDIEGLDTKEAAELLGLSQGVVKTRLHRARQALRTLLDPYFREEQA